jgi:hypothetical protein
VKLLLALSVVGRRVGWKELVPPGQIAGRVARSSARASFTSTRLGSSIEVGGGQR